MKEQSTNLDFLKKANLKEKEKTLLKKWIKNRLMQWIVVDVIMIVMAIVFSFVVYNEAKNGMSMDLLFKIMLLIFSVCIPFTSYKEIKKLRINVEDIRVCKATITEKRYVSSKEMNGKRNIYVAAKINRKVTLYANCDMKIYTLAEENKSEGLFFTLEDGIMRVLLIQ